MSLKDNIQKRDQFRPPDEWTEQDEQQKQKLFNQAFKNRNQLLLQTRIQLDILNHPDRDETEIIGTLYETAYNMVNAAMIEGQVSDKHDVDEEKWNKVLEQFQETVSPWKLKELSRKSKKINRTPRAMKDIMEEKGSKVYQLIGWAFAGSSVMDDTTDSLESSMPGTSEPTGY